MKKATPEYRKKLYDMILINMEESVAEIEKNINLLRFIDELSIENQFFNKNFINHNFAEESADISSDQNNEIAHNNDIHKIVINFSLFINYFICDFYSSLRLFFISEHRYEEIFALRQLIVITNESYKKIYNFEIIDKNNEINLKNRNISILIKNIKPYIENNIPELKNDLFKLFEELDAFYNLNFDGIYDTRNISIHYDDSPFIFYNMLISLDSEKVIKNFISYFRIIELLSNFSKKMTILHVLKFESETLKHKQTILDNFTNIENILPIEKREIFIEFKNKILKLYEKRT